MSPVERRTPSEWEQILGIQVLDPDGWDRQNFDQSWAEPITEGEFLRRAAVLAEREDS